MIDLSIFNYSFLFLLSLSILFLFILIHFYKRHLFCCPDVFGCVLMGRPCAGQ